MTSDVYGTAEAIGTGASQPTPFSTPEDSSGGQYPVYGDRVDREEKEEYGTGADLGRPLGLARHEGQGFVCKQVDRGLVQRAILIVKDVDLTDPIQCTLALPAIATVLRDLWQSAAKSSPEHRQILTIAEAAVLSWDHIDDRRCSALLEAMSDLLSPIATESHVEVIRSRFIDEGWNPLALLSDIGDGTDD